MAAHSHPSEILIVDDNNTNLLLIESLLAEHGHTLRTAQNGKLAMESIGKAPPDLILLDLIMPVVDGYETLAWLRACQEYVDIPVIIISSLSDPGDKLNSFELGAVDFLKKPIDPVELTLRVSSQLKWVSRVKQLKEEVSSLKGSIRQTQLTTSRTLKLQKEVNALSEELGRIQPYNISPDDKVF